MLGKEQESEGGKNETIFLVTTTGSFLATLEKLRLEK